MGECELSIMMVRVVRKREASNLKYQKKKCAPAVQCVSCFSIEGQYDITAVYFAVDILTHIFYKSEMTYARMTLLGLR